VSSVLVCEQWVCVAHTSQYRSLFISDVSYIGLFSYAITSLRQHWEDILTHWEEIYIKRNLYATSHVCTKTCVGDLWLHTKRDLYMRHHLCKRDLYTRSHLWKETYIRDITYEKRPIYEISLMNRDLYMRPHLWKETFIYMRKEIFTHIHTHIHTYTHIHTWKETFIYRSEVSYIGLFSYAKNDLLQRLLNESLTTFTCLSV